jgi:hypothetical protein
MPQIVEQLVEIGRDAYGRRVTARRHRTYDGKTMWRVVTDPYDQRDDGYTIDGLTDQNLRDLIQAVELVQK